MTGFNRFWPVAVPVTQNWAKKPDLTRLLNTTNLDGQNPKYKFRQARSKINQNSSRNMAQIQPKLATVYTPNMFGQNFKNFPQYVWHLQNFQILFRWPMASKISNFVQTDMASKTDFFYLFYQVLRTTRLIHGSAKTFCELLR